MTATHFLYAAAGRPVYPTPQTGTCRICAERAVGAGFDAWVRDTFTNYDLLHPGDIICAPCQFYFDQQQPELTQRTGKDKLQRMQNYSHFVVDGEWIPLSKADKTRMADLLPRAQLAVIADSGQKHLIFRARPGWWQFEEKSMQPDVARLQTILAGTTRLYRVFSKTEIETGRYGQRRMLDYGLTALLADEAALAPARGTPYFDLALFLTQKGKDDDIGDGPERISAGVSCSAEDVDPALAGSQRGVQTEIRAQHLESVRGQSTGGGLRDDDQQVLQQSLFPPPD